MENIVTLILIFITLWSISRKFKGRQKTKQGATPPDGGWVTKLNAFLVDLQKETEQQPKDRTTVASGWEEILDDGEESGSPSDVDEAALDDLVFEEAQTPPHPEKILPAVPVRARTTPSDKSPLDPGIQRCKALHAGKPSSAFMAVSRAELRKALIWSEILAPPLALRDQFGDRR